MQIPNNQTNLFQICIIKIQIFYYKEEKLSYGYVKKLTTSVFIRA